MKKVIAILLSILLAFSLTACNSKSLDASPTQPDSRATNMVNKATNKLTKIWKDYYRESAPESSDGYLEIKNVRLISIKSDVNEREFDNVKFVVEYVLFSDLRGSHPYYSNAGINNTVVVYDNDSMKVVEYNPFNTYTSRTYNTDFTEIIENIEDFGGEFNQIFMLK